MLSLSIITMLPLFTESRCRQKLKGMLLVANCYATSHGGVQFSRCPRASIFDELHSITCYQTN